MAKFIKLTKVYNDPSYIDEKKQLRKKPVYINPKMIIDMSRVTEWSSENPPSYTYVTTTASIADEDTSGNFFKVIETVEEIITLIGTGQ